MDAFGIHWSAWPGVDADVGELVVLTGLLPDTRGWLHVEVQVAQGQFADLNLLELEVEAR